MENQPARTTRGRRGGGCVCVRGGGRGGTHPTAMYRMCEFSPRVTSARSERTRAECYKWAKEAYSGSAWPLCHCHTLGGIATAFCTFCVYVCLYVCPSPSPSLSLSVFLSLSWSFFVSLSLSVCLSVFLPVTSLSLVLSSSLSLSPPPPPLSLSLSEVLSSGSCGFSQSER